MPQSDCFSGRLKQTQPSLLIKSVRLESLQSITATDISAEGVIASLGGTCWHRYKPRDGIWRSPRKVYSACWNMSRSTLGERWQDDPIVVAVSYQRDA